jgi:glutaredoxin 2
MALGFLNIEAESIVLSYADEKTPIELMNKKMLPIFDFGDGNVSNESLDIIKILDAKDLLNNKLLENKSDNDFIEELLTKIGKPVHNLCMPYWIWTPEFDDNSRAYFLKKKEAKRGPFNILAQNKKVHLIELAKVLADLRPKLKPFILGEEFSIADIMIASHLWGMYVLPEFQFPADIHEYLQKVRSLTKFNYHKDFWINEKV